MPREDYEERIEARRDRLASRAEKAASEAAGRLGAAHRLANSIPLGQPILIGHHSEKRARKDAERIHNNMRRGIEAQKEAAELRGRAGPVGTGGISSDDPAAVVKLKEELAALVEKRDHRKAVNAAYRKGGWEAVAKIIPMTPEAIARRTEEMKALPSFDQRPYPAYSITNLGANIRRIEQRIAELQKEAAREPAPPIVGNGWRIEERADINRVAISFKEKPPETIREVLRASGFHYSPSEGANLRLLNASGRAAGARLATLLANHYGVPQAAPSGLEPPAPSTPEEGAGQW